MRGPTRFGQPIDEELQKVGEHARRDFGGVHVDSGIHNFAAFDVMTATAAEVPVQTGRLAAMFYLALTQQLSRESTFSDSRRGVVLATRSLFRMLPQNEIETRARAVRPVMRRG